MFVSQAKAGLPTPGERQNGSGANPSTPTRAYPRLPSNSSTSYLIRGYATLNGE